MVSYFQKGCHNVKVERERVFSRLYFLLREMGKEVYFLCVFMCIQYTYSHIFCTLHTASGSWSIRCWGMAIINRYYYVCADVFFSLLVKRKGRNSSTHTCIIIYWLLPRQLYICIGEVQYALKKCGVCVCVFYYTQTHNTQTLCLDQSTTARCVSYYNRV